MKQEIEWLEYWIKIFEQSAVRLKQVVIHGRTYTNAAEMKTRLGELKK